MNEDVEIAAAFDFLLRLKGWKVSDLARAAKLSVRDTRFVVKGKPSITQNLRQLCDALGFPLWLFWWVGTVTSAPADSRELKDLWPQLEGGATFHRRRGLDLVKEGMVLLLVESGAGPRRTKPRPGRNEVRAAWMRISEHAEALRLMTGELVDLTSAPRWAAAELEDAGELFATATNATTQTLRLLCLSRLYSFFNAERAVVLYREAMGRIRPEGRCFFSFPVPVDVAELERALA